jgi:hypothetical protein
MFNKKINERIDNLYELIDRQTNFIERLAFEIDHLKAIINELPNIEDIHNKVCEHKWSKRPEYELTKQQICQQNSEYSHICLREDACH